MKVMLWKIIYRGNLKSHTLSFTKAFCDQQGIDVIRVFYIYSSFYTTGVATGVPSVLVPQWQWRTLK